MAEFADLDGSPTARYIYAGSQRIAMVDSSNNVYYYLNDHLGSAGVLITSTGTVRDKYKYKPFGDNNGSSIINGQSYRYTGKPLDEELDLDWYYYGARYYSPEAGGRFLAVDPLNSKYPSWSPYVYVRDNPLRRIDPTGMADTTATSSNTGTPGVGFQGSLNWTGAVTYRAGVVRAQYTRASSGLGISGTLRRDTKILYRSRTPQPYRSALQAYRPIELEAAGIRMGPSASRTNPRFNRMGGMARAAGKSMLGVGVAWSLYDIATADNKARETAGQVGGWGAGLTGGWVGCQGCAILFAPAGPYGMGAGCIIGGVVFGGISFSAGEDAAKEIYDRIAGGN